MVMGGAIPNDLEASWITTSRTSKSYAVTISDFHVAGASVGGGSSQSSPPNPNPHPHPNPNPNPNPHPHPHPHPPPNRIQAATQLLLVQRQQAMAQLAAVREAAEPQP